LFPGGCSEGILFHLTTGSKPALRPTQPPVHWVQGHLSQVVKRPDRDDCSHSSSAEVMNSWSYTSAPQYVSMAWYLGEHRDNSNFTLIILYSFRRQVVTTVPMWLIEESVTSVYDLKWDWH